MNSVCIRIGLVVAPSLALGAEPITSLKPLHLTTTLTRDGQPRAMIVAPPEDAYAAVTALIRDRVRELGRVDLPVRTPTDVAAEELSRTNVILVGNAADNALVRRMVWERWILDTWYPGDETFVVRSVHNPLGRGGNVIFIGGENPETTGAAARAFLGRLEPGDPLEAGWLMLFESDERGGEVTPDTVKHHTQRADQALGFKNGRNLISSAAAMARNYYQTGRAGWADLFRVVMERHKAIGAPGMGTHMNVYDTVSMWELIEESPAFSDADRLWITNHLLYILRSGEGCMHGFFRKGTKTAGVRHNHQTLPGLACLFGGRYFQLGYDLPEADEWLRAANALFDSQKVAHKPQCDCNQYEWGTLYQTGWWSLGSGDYTFFESGACRAAVERAIVEMDNRGTSSCNGDCWSLTYFPTILFRQAAAFYRDGRYEWAVRKHYASSGSPDRRGVANMVRGVAPEEPTDLLGVTVAPMSPDFYHARSTTMPSEPESNIPLERSFDKVSFRRSFDREDQYLLLDGIGRGSHGHVDVNGISHFTDNDRIWLMDVSYAEAPNMRDHNVVTIIRDGETTPPPPLAALDGVADLDRFGLCTTSVPAYCGMDWRRLIFWSKERYFLFMDQLTAVEAGDYTMRAHWRTPGRGEVSGTTFSVRQQAGAQGEPVRRITRKDADGAGACMKIVRQDGSLRTSLDLAGGQWQAIVFGCGHHPGDDSFHLYVDGVRVADVHVSRTEIKPSSAVPFTVATAGRHEISLRLRESPGTICDRLLLTGPDGRQVTVDALDMEGTAATIPRTDTFTLLCTGADKVGLSLDEENVGKWFKSYPYSSPVVSIVQQSASAAMRQGESHVFANLFFVSNDDDRVEAEMRPIAGGVVLIRDGDAVTCAVAGPASFRLGEAEVEIRAGQAVLQADRLAVRAGTAVSWRGSVLSEQTPVSAERPIQGDATARSADLQRAWDAAASASRPARPRPLPEPTRTLRTEWRAALGSPVLAIAQGAGAGRVVAVGCGDGTVRLLDGGGHELWSFATGGKVNSVALADIGGDGDCEVIAGSDDRCCYVLGRDGKERWRYQGAAGGDPYWRRYWKAGEVEKVLAADLDGDGRKEVVFAAANMNVHACDGAGKLLWTFTQYGVCTSLLAVDLTGAGKENVVGGPAKITCTSNCSVLDEAGKAVSRFGNDGWASALTAVCAADLDGDGRIQVICGTNMNNVRALDYADGELKERWRFAAGDVVTALCPVRVGPGASQRVAAGSASEYVYCLDGAGAVAWRRQLGGAVAGMVSCDLDGDGRDELIASTGDRLHVLDVGGGTLARLSPGAAITALDGDGGLLLGTSAGALTAVALAEP